MAKASTPKRTASKSAGGSAGKGAGAGGSNGRKTGSTSASRASASSTTKRSASARSGASKNGTASRKSTASKNGSASPSRGASKNGRAPRSASTASARSSAPRSTASRSSAARSPSAARPSATRSSAARSRSASGGGQRQKKPDKQPGGIQGLIARRAANDSLAGPDRRLWGVQKRFWSLINDHYFRLDTDGWHRLPEAPALLIGVHSGGALTMDAWTFVFEWYRRFEFDRILHGTAHDLLMATPLFGDYLKANGTISASRQSVSKALNAGHDVIIWPGGEEDSMRSWRKRDQAVLAGRKGFIRMAMNTGVPIVPVASVGGSDTGFVLTEGRFLTKLLPGVSKALRGATLPIMAGLPFGIAPELLPTHLPLPAKIRTEILDPIEVEHDPERVDDKQYVDSVYREVRGALQAGMDELAKRRSFPVMG